MMESRICIKCQQEINPLRVKALPNTKTCVDCSTTGAKRGVPMMFGEKDHTWTDMIIMDPEEFDQFEKLNKQQPTFEVLDKSEMNSDEDDLADWDTTLMDGLEDEPYTDFDTDTAPDPLTSNEPPPPPDNVIKEDKIPINPKPDILSYRNKFRIEREKKYKK